MDAGFLRYMFAHHVYHIVHSFHRIKRRTAFFGRHSRMRTQSAKPELGRFVGQSACHGYFILVSGVPMDGGIKVFKQSFAHHIYFAAATLFGRAAIYFYGTGQLFSGYQFLDGYSGSYACRSKQVVSAAMPAFLSFNAFLFRNRFLRKPGQSIVLGKHPNHRAAAAVSGYKSGGDACYSCFNRKAVILQHFLQKGAALGFFIAEFGVVPYLQGGLTIQIMFSLNTCKGLIFNGLYGRCFCLGIYI